MKIVDFYPTHFNDIPKQDNPAFGNKECVMIVGDSSQTWVTNRHAVVLHIVPNTIESTTSIAKFWKYNRALRFCDTFEA